MNGQAPLKNWTGLFRPGEKIRLRFINGSAMTYFDIRIPGLKMTVVAADGQYVNRLPLTNSGLPLPKPMMSLWSLRVRPIHLRTIHGQDRLRSRDTGHERGVKCCRSPPRSPSSVDHGRYGYGGNGT
ncbi:hypothetical protein [Enterobacter hormaechei]|uniref:hypothetical protein n=1 Tax=Enterobacter hormaechei TaxID=158836 RepID=UPI003B969980